MLKYLAVSTALRLGFSIAKKTPVHDVKNLLGRLHPVVTEHRLLRLGCTGDGGYLIPDDLDVFDACFSPGVDD